MEVVDPLGAKQKRAKNIKVRTGCTTCKLRRVKCDEKKPSCHRCDLAGRECKYVTVIQFKPKPLLPKSLVPIRMREPLKQKESTGSKLSPIYDRRLFLAPSALSVSLPGNELEHRYFQLFHEQVAQDLCGYFHTPFWTRLILQECHHEPAIRHEIFAISALYKASTAQPGERNSHRQFALIQQGKALGQLQKSLSRGSLRLALLASLVLGTFESLYGNVDSAAQQISSGVRLLKYWHDRKANEGKHKMYKAVAYWHSRSNTVDPELYAIITRLEMQLLTFIVMNPAADQTIQQVHDEAKIEIIPIPDRFLTLGEAMPFATQSCMLSLHHLRRCLFYKTSSPPIKMPAALMHNQINILKGMSRWKAAFAPLLEEISRNISQIRHLAALQFDIGARAFEIAIETSLLAGESIYDMYNESFLYIVNSSRITLQWEYDLMSAAQRVNPSIDKAVDGRENEEIQIPRQRFDMGLIYPLFYTATRCRDSQIRRQAIALLRKWKGRNGVWDGEQAASIAEWVVSLEEGGMTDVRRGFVAEDNWSSVERGFVDEKVRVRMHTLKWVVDVKLDIIRAECVQGAEDGQAKLRKVTLPCR